MHSRQDAQHLGLPDEYYPHITTRTQRRAGHIFGHSPSPSTSSSSASSIVSEESFIMIQKPKANLIASFFTPIIKRSPHARKASNPRAFQFPAGSDSKPKGHLASALLHIQPLSISPVSPTFSIDLEKKQATRADIRLKKINKLARTFGEEIPPELVFPDEHDIESAERSSNKTTSAKASPRPLPKVPSPATRSHESKPSTSSSSPTLAERRRGHRPRSLSLGTGTSVLAANAARFIIENESQDPEPPRSQSTPPTRPCSTKKSCRDLALRAMTIKEKAVVDGYGLPKSPLPFQTTLVPMDGVTEGSRAASRSSSHLPIFSSSDIESDASRPTNLAFTSSVTTEYGYRKEREWSGEWNVKDMHDIVKVLRDLKCR